MLQKVRPISPCFQRAKHGAEQHCKTDLQSHGKDTKTGPQCANINLGKVQFDSVADERARVGRNAKLVAQIWQLLRLKALAKIHLLQLGIRNHDLIWKDKALSSVEINVRCPLTS